MLMLTVRPMGMLAIAETEYSRSDLLAIVVVADGAGGTGSVDGGVAKEETVRDWLFLWSASGFLV